MSHLIETVRDVAEGQDILRRRRYGMIEASKGRLVLIRLKPWPKMGSLLEAHWLQSMKSKRQQHDVCRLYYNQPIGHSRYLALSYVESSLGTSLKTVYKTLDTLSQIAFIKRSDAILAEITTNQITDRALARRGWERHLEHQKKRHWIKRFYGEYPDSVKDVLEQTSVKMLSSAE